MDNGPELTAHALRDWCRFSDAGTSYIEPGSPWENPFVESFNGKLRDELLDGEIFETLLWPRSWLKASGSTTTNTDHTHPSATWHRPPSPRNGSPTNGDSQSWWTRRRGQVTGENAP
jgi:putative transposase